MPLDQLAMAGIAGKASSPVARGLADLLANQAGQLGQADQADQDDEQADPDLKKRADDNDQLDVAQADTMSPSDWHKFFG